MDNVINETPLYLFVGKSASGKTTVADLLESKYGFKQVWSLTTRPPRYEGETGHVFVSEEEFFNSGKLAAYTFYNDNHYGTTFDQLNECSIYVIDPKGVETLLSKYIGRPIVILYFNASVYTRIHRMLDRGDSDTQIIGRLLEDEKADWETWLLNSMLYLDNEDVTLHNINADAHLDNVVEQVLKYF